MKGNYILVLKNSRNIKANIGKLGDLSFKEGIYLYLGSALGKGSMALEKRLGRHRKKRKKLHWHIDYLSVLPQIKVVMFYYVISNLKMECQLKKLLIKVGGKIIHSNFGSTDCHCGGHLIFFQSLKDVHKAIKTIIDLNKFELKSLDVDNSILF